MRRTDFDVATGNSQINFQPSIGRGRAEGPRGQLFALTHDRTRHGNRYGIDSFDHSRLGLKRSLENQDRTVDDSAKKSGTTQ